jgi:hypothetical protein
LRISFCGFDFSSQRGNDVAVRNIPNGIVEIGNRFVFWKIEEQREQRSEKGCVENTT